MDTVDFLLDERDPQTIQPNNIRLTMKAHQLAALHRMIMLDRDCGMSLKAHGIDITSNIGILADLPAYGKTLTMLALIEALKDTQGAFAPRSYLHGTNYGILYTKKQHLQNLVPTTLIVVPDNLVTHWQQHLDRYTELCYEIVDKREMHMIPVEEYTALLCPARYYNNFVHFYRYTTWNRVIFDEADSIYIPNTASVQARFLWLISSTYENIPRRRNRGFLKDIFIGLACFEDPLKFYYRPVVVKGKDNFVKQSFALQEPEEMFVDCVAPRFVQAIQKHISPKIMEYINAGDLDSAILALGGNVDTDRNVMSLVTRKLRNEITKINSKLKTLDELEIPAHTKAERNKEYAERLDSLGNRLDALTKSIEKASTSDCMICYDTLSHPTLVPCCNNLFCAGCLLKWLKTSHICPLCRGTFDPNQLYTISETEPPRSAHRKHTSPKKDKLESMLDIITKRPTGKFLVFSGHTATFDRVGQLLREHGKTYGTLKTTIGTEKTIAKFRSGMVSIILLNAEYNGAGLELPEATDVILFHQLRPSLELQTIGRAQRPGRTSQLRVWKLRYPHEYK